MKSTLVKDSCGDLMTIKEFKSDVKNGFLINYDGFGHYSDGINEFDEIVNLRKIKNGFTHVVWYNR